MLYLYDLADHMGITIEYAPLHTRNGEYRHDLNLIRLRQGMNDRLERWTLAHELGHAAHAHTPTTPGQPNPRQERQADEWAALRLININDYRDAELSHNGHTGAIAHDLNLPEIAIHAYQRMLARIGDNVYLKPGHGAGGWLEKLDA